MYYNSKKVQFMFIYLLFFLNLFNLTIFNITTETETLDQNSIIPYNYHACNSVENIV